MWNWRESSPGSFESGVFFFIFYLLFFFNYLFNSFSGGVHSVLTWTSDVNDSIMTLEVPECGTLTPTKSFPARFGRVDHIPATFIT